MAERDKKFSFKRFSTLLIVLSIHLGGIFIPLGIAFFVPAEPKPIPFRVKLGGSEPSHAPEIGPPQRRPPSENPGGGTPPPPPPPEEPVPPVSPPPVPETPPPTPPKPVKPVKPTVPKPVKPVKPTVPKPDVAKKKREQERRKKLLEQKKRQEQARKKKLLEQKKRQEQIRRKKLLEQKKQQEQARRKKLLEQKKREEQARRRADWLRRQAEKRKREQQNVHHDSRWDNWDPNKKSGGGSNYNPRVPVGSRDRGQTRGPVDGRTPAGGATVNEEKYWERVSDFFHERWRAPAGIFVTAETAVTIEVTFDRNGKVLSKRIIKRSPNAAVNQSAQVMLDKLDYIPTPPAGIGTSFQLNLVSQ